nr:hypothetical protein [Tanacetum cinerariifolium]
MDDPAGYKAVIDYMLHGPCGKDARYTACNVEGKCSKHFPKAFCVETIIDQDGYPIYRRRDNKVSVKKGPDRATIVIQENIPNGQGVTPENVVVVDEIKNYLNCRYLAPCEAVWRILSFDIHYAYLSVMKLNFHMPDQLPVTLRDSECLPDLLEREGINVTMFTDWFDLNERHPPARILMYAEILQNYVCHEQSKIWKQRKQRKCIGRIVYSTPSLEERYFLRMLLNVVRGPQTFEEPLTVNRRVCATFKESCFSYGLLNDDREWTRAIQKARGIEKTFLYKTIISRLRSERKIVLAVASSGIASLFLLARRTTHSRFIISIELLENSTCGIKQNTHLTKLMQEVELIIWDEAPTIQKYASEALDKTLRYILGYLAPENKNKIFGGLTVLLGSNFRQILPIVAETYPTFIERQSDIAYLRERAILTLRNDDADTINAYMFDKLEGESVTYNSADE